ncbi:hypothetical protein SprV_0401695900 [Sparganum proliferum]
MHPRSRHWRLLDYVLVRRRDQRNVLVTKVIPGADGWTDHRLAITKIRIRLQPRRRPQGNRPTVFAVAASDEGASVENRWCLLRDTVHSTAQAVLCRAHRQHQDWFDDIDAAISTKPTSTTPPTRTELLSLISELAQRLVNLPVSVVAASYEGASVENRWCQLRDTVQLTALVVLGRAHRQHQYCFDDIDAVISNLLVERNRLHTAYVDHPYKQVHAQVIVPIAHCLVAHGGHRRNRRSNCHSGLADHRRW